MTDLLSWFGGNFGSMPLPWWSMLECNSTRGPVPLSYLIQRWKQVKRPLSSRFLASMQMAEVTRTLGTVVAGFFIHGAWLGPIILLLSFPCFPFFDLSRWRARGKSDEERNHLTLKRILEVVKQEYWENQSCFAGLTHLSVGRDIMCMFHFTNESGDTASWQVSLIMLVLDSISAVYLASQIGKKWNSNQVFPILVAWQGWPCFW